MSIQQIRLWFNELWHWLAEGKLVFMCLLVIAAAVILAFIGWPSERAIRSSGYLLQFIGMITAIRGLLGIRKHFGQPLLRKLLVDWFKRFPKWKNKIVACVGTANCVMSAGIVRAEVWCPDDPGKQLEERIEKIIRNLDVIRDEQRNHSELIEKLKHSHDEYKKKITEQTEKMEEDILSDLESLHTSDLIPSLVGLVWLLVGISMSTMSPELYKWLN